MYFRVGSVLFMAVNHKIDDASGRGTVAGYKVSFPARQHGYTGEEIEAVVEVMRNAECQTQGRYLKQFETDFKIFFGANHAFAVNNCTNALKIAARLCRFQPGDEVIIPAYTFCATAIPFGMVGAKIVWADIDRETWVIDPGDIKRKITAKTRAIVVVHLLGMPADMPVIMEIAEKHSLRVIEDCAQSMGAQINGKYTGTFGDFACFSFHGAKGMTTLGEGGMLIVRDDKDAELVSGLRHNGVRAFAGDRKRYWIPAMSDVDVDIDGVWPDNFCMGEAQCALGSVMLGSVHKNNNKLIEQGMKIKEQLAGIPEITFSRIPDGCRHVFHQCVMHFDGSAFGKNRDDLLDILTDEYKIRAIVQYYPLYRYPLFKKLGAGGYDCPVLENWWDNAFSFPWWCGMPEETIEYLTASVKEAIKLLKSNRRK